MIRNLASLLLSAAVLSTGCFGPGSGGGGGLLPPNPLYRQSRPSWLR